MEQRLTTPWICLRAGISLRVLDYWARSGWFPDVEGLGSGTARRWTYEHVLIIDVLAGLSRAGSLTPARGRAVVDSAVAERLDGYMVISAQNQVEWAANAENMMVMVRAFGGVVTVVDLARVHGQ